MPVLLDLQVRIYPVSTGADQPEVIAPSCTRVLPSKLSSLCWSPVHEVGQHSTLF